MPFAKLETDGGTERLFDFVRENLPARLVDAARPRSAPPRAATTGQPDPTPYGPALAMAGGSAPEAVPPGFAELWAAIEAYRIWNESWPKTGRQNEDRMGGRTRIAVRIGPSAIDTVSWFFNAGLDDILHEMLHNARSRLRAARRHRDRRGAGDQ